MKNKKLKILFLYPNINMRTLVPNAISILTAALKKDGFKNIELFDTTFYEAKGESYDEERVEMAHLPSFDFKDRDIEPKKTDMFQDFVKKVNDFKFDIIFASIVEDTFPIFLKFMDMIKEKKIPCLAGGVFPSSVPERVIKLDCVDYVCRGEGEDALVELANALEEKKDPSNIQNLWIKKNGKIVAKNKIRPALDVNNLPVQDLSIFEDISLFRPMMGKIYRMAPVETQRGCPYACRFCNSPEKNEFYNAQKAGKFFRKRTIQNVHEEIKEIISKYGIEYIMFITDTFLAMSEKEFDEFCEMYSEFNLPFFMNTRPETITERRAKKLKEINCHRANIGVEHGNYDFRVNVAGRRYKNEFAIKAFSIMHDAGISTQSNNIVGYPDETRELVFDTIELTRKLKCNDINAYTFTPYHGTSLRQLCEQKNYIDKDSLSHIYATDSMLDMPTISKAEIKGLIKTFVLYSRLPRSYWAEIKIAESETDEGVEKYKELMNLYQKEFKQDYLARD